ncbi:MAG: phosphoribosylformylglycinamidine synthase subunit PurS, partial [Candidatus Omnitrophica bacterium]|nr:phosphoribosylformylglycinamidine synthase subunit PurS [Candidatus Omnitrophota bacterium]
MVYQIEVKIKNDFFDPQREGLKKDILDLGVSSVSSVEVAQLYFLKGEISEIDLRRICEELLTDPLTQEYCLTVADYQYRRREDEFTLVVAYNPGVMDPWEDSALKGIRDLGIKGVEAIRTAKKYVLKGALTQEELNFIADKLLVNKTIQHILDKKTGFSFENPEYKFKLITIDILKANNKKLKEMSVKGQLFLSIPEMLQIKKYFKKLGRNPTDCELETIAQTWSEHCRHKTLKGKIEYKEILNSKPKTQIINNLLRETIMKVTEELKKPWCVSVFNDNSGVIRFDKDYNICFKVETHNHPSALEPYGGANTGIGGVIRDPLGTGLGAKPIANTDVFCFGPPDYPYEKLPPGVLHPKRIMKGVVAGVRDYGNKMGIPTVNGAVIFDERYVGNPLVYCGTVGLLPKDKSFKKVLPGDLIL